MTKHRLTAMDPQPMTRCRVCRQWTPAPNELCTDCQQLADLYRKDPTR